MIKVFLSKPTGLGPRYHKVFRGFLHFLRTQNLEVHSLGSRDYAIRNPLSEIIKILGQCKGLITLGYPDYTIGEEQVSVVRSHRQRLDNVKLATEWNHIETALAYQMGIPLLVIHEVGLERRGIFSHGAMDAYIHTADFGKVGWWKDEKIKGPFCKWKETVSSAPKPTQLTKYNGFWLEQIKYQSKRKYSIGKLDWDGQRFRYNGSNYNNKGTVNYKWKTVASHVDGKGRFFYIYEVDYKSGEVPEHGFGWIKVEDRGFGFSKISTATGWFVDAWRTSLHTKGGITAEAHNIDMYDLHELAKLDIRLQRLVGANPTKNARKIIQFFMRKGVSKRLLKPK